MDNKQDRNFYWEVKDFMGKPQEIHKPVKTPNDMVSSIKNILEQNKLYKPSSFNSNINSASTIRQAINAIERNNQRGTPENIQHTKNITSNPFGVIREGIFDETSDAVSKKIKGIAGNIGMSTDATAGEVGAQVDGQQLTPGVPLTPDQKAMRDLEGQVKAKEDITPANLNTNTQQANSNPNPNAQSTQLPNGTWVDDNGNPIPGAPTPEDRSADDRENNRGKAPMAPVAPPPPPPPPPSSDTQSEPAPKTQNSSGEDLSGKIGALRKAYTMRRGDGDGGGKAGAAERTADRRARSDAIRDANIALRSTPEGEKKFRQQKAARGTKDFNFDVALRYAKPGQRGGSQQSEAETNRIANEFVASQKEGRKPNYQSSAPTSSSNSTTNQPGVDITRQSPGQAAAMNDPARGGQSGRFGGDKNKNTPTPTPAPAEDRSADNRENNRGKAPMVSNTPADDVKDGDFSRRDGSRGNTNTPAPAPASDDDVKTGDFSRRDGSHGNMGSGMPSKTPTPPSTTPLSTTTNTGSGLGSGFLNSPTEETAPNILPKMTLTGKDVNKKDKELSTP